MLLEYFEGTGHEHSWTNSTIKEVLSEVSEDIFIRFIQEKWEIRSRGEGRGTHPKHNSDATKQGFHISYNAFTWYILIDTQTVLVNSPICPVNNSNIMDHYSNTPFLGDGGGGGSPNPNPTITQCAKLPSVDLLILNHDNQSNLSLQGPIIFHGRDDT